MHTGCWFKKPEGKRPFRRLRHRWEKNIGMDFKEIEFELE
jgi:hypothetical protein